MRTEFSSLTWILLQHQISVINPGNDGGEAAESGHAAEDNLSVCPGDLVHPHHHGLVPVRPVEPGELDSEADYLHNTFTDNLSSVLAISGHSLYPLVDNVRPVEVPVHGPVHRHPGHGANVGVQQCSLLPRGEINDVYPAASLLSRNKIFSSNTQEQLLIWRMNGEEPWSSVLSSGQNWSN